MKRGKLFCMKCGRGLAMNITSERCTHCKKIRQGKMLQAEVHPTYPQSRPSHHLLRPR